MNNRVSKFYDSDFSKAANDMIDAIGVNGPTGGYTLMATFFNENTVLCSITTDCSSNNEVTNAIKELFTQMNKFHNGLSQSYGIPLEIISKANVAVSIFPMGATLPPPPVGD